MICLSNKFLDLKIVKSKYKNLISLSIKISSIIFQIFAKVFFNPYLLASDKMAMFLDSKANVFIKDLGGLTDIEFLPYHFIYISRNQVINRFEMIS
jgi:hypothetical protein